jgi:hypothetical protein
MILSESDEVRLEIGDFSVDRSLKESPVACWISKSRKWGRNPPSTPPSIASIFTAWEDILLAQCTHIIRQNPQYAPNSTQMPAQSRPTTSSLTALPALPRTPNNLPAHPRKPHHLGNRRHCPAQTCQSLLLYAPLLHPRSALRIRRRPNLGHRPHDKAARGYWLPSLLLLAHGSVGSCDEWCAVEAVRGA